ncbi:hypothetical protein KY285_021153 [Solanum tuberosum]|nr:hypothetical protein KY285_021153 [Solanum tuberosum]
MSISSSTLGDLTELKILYFHSNQLSGLIPSELGNLKNLNDMELSHNNLTSSIPTTLSNLTELKILYIHSNQLSGLIPRELGNMKNLNVLELQENQLTGPIPASFGNLRNLQFLYLCENKLSGSIPKELAYLDDLVDLIISENQFSGHLPEHLCQGGKLENFQMNSNKLTGPFIDLSDKDFHGELSNNWGKCENLIDLHVARVNISGSIPPEIGNVKGLLGLDLSSNNLIGQIPKEFGKLRSLVNFFLQNNRISGNIPEELGSLTKLESLDLSDNRLNGSILMCIVDFVQLFQLNLSNNKFGQKIQKEIGRTTQLNVLDLSYNLMVGDIPLQLANLKDVVLSYNELEGPIPNNKAFINASLEGNNGLCGNVAGLDPCEMSSSVVKKHSMAKGRKLIVITVLPVMGALILLCVFVVVLFMCDKRRLRDEFDAKFCIGLGGHESVYKIDLSSLGNTAVKRLHSSFQNTHPKSFMNEVRALTGIKHQNIVNLYGYCSSAQNSFLVYEVNIIKGVAFALSYMHQDCSPLIVHRDISSSNVLLDSEYEARVADFGITKILKPDSTNRTALAGTYGYVAPGKF